MFKLIVLLKVSPWFLYADNDKDAFDICAKFKDDVTGIVTGENIMVKQPRSTYTLEQVEVLQVTHAEFDNKISTEVSDDQTELDIIQASQELEEEFKKLTKELE